MVMPFMGPAGQADTRLFLSDESPEVIARAIQLWDQYSGAPGLLSGTGDYEYDQDRKVYVNKRTGRDVTEDQLRRYVRKVSDEASRQMKKDTQQLIAGIIMLTVWYSRMRNLMMALYKTVWILGIGGFVFDDNIQRNLFYLFTLMQFNWLDNFSEQVYSGMQPLNGFAMTRAGLYGRTANGMWQNIRLLQAEETGYTEGMRVLGVTEDHCMNSDRPGCIEQAARGWVPIRSIVPIGQCTCFSNCLCRLRFR